MVGFWVELLRRAGAEMLSAKGTTWLGGVVVPIAFFVLQFLIKLTRARKLEFNTDDLIADGVAAGVIWILLFSWFLFVAVPREIRQEANRNIARITVPDLPVHKGWRISYDLRKQHEKIEADALTKGIITPEREQRIHDGLASSGMSCTVNFYLLGGLQSAAFRRDQKSY